MFFSGVKQSQVELSEIRRLADSGQFLFNDIETCMNFVMKHQFFLGLIALNILRRVLKDQNYRSSGQYNSLINYNFKLVQNIYIYIDMKVNDKLN